MVRAPCCEKMGLKRGPWTPEEDRVLVAYINRYGHGNWRALPKQAGLLRCGKSCRLRWTNYLRPDIKRGNFTREEEEAIISLHELLGNRWSAIAARLPGRTDNEIKNVWHTHLKKRLNSSSNPAEQDTKRKKCRSVAAAAKAEPRSDSNRSADSPAGSSSSDVSSSSAATTATAKEECMEESFEGFPEIDESFWSDALSMNSNVFGFESLSSSSSNNGDGDDMSFWLKVFMESGDSLELPDI